MGLLKLAIDRQTKSLVSVSGSVTSPILYQINQQDFQIQIVDAPIAFGAGYTAVDCSAAGLRVLILDQVTGNQDDTRLAQTLEAGWAWDSGSQAFLGTIDLNTAEMQAYLGPLGFKSAILEINLMTGGVPETVFGAKNGSVNLTINANGDDGTADPPEILTQAQITGTVAIQDGVGGVTLVDNLFTLSGLALSESPAHVFIWINAPSGSGPIYGCFVAGSATSDHFSVILSAIPANNNYSVTYALTF